MTISRITTLGLLTAAAFPVPQFASIDRKTETAEVTQYPAACPGPFEQTMSNEKKDMEKMLKDRPDLARDPEFTKNIVRVEKALAESAKKKDMIHHWTIEDPPFWKEFKKKLIKPNVQ